MDPILILSDSEEEMTNQTSKRYVISIDPGQVNMGVSVLDIFDNKFVYLKIVKLTSASGYNKTLQ